MDPGITNAAKAIAGKTGRLRMTTHPISVSGNLLALGHSIIIASKTNMAVGSPIEAAFHLIVER